MSTKLYKVTGQGDRILSSPKESEKDIETLRFISKVQCGDNEVAQYIFDGDKSAARASIGRLLQKRLIVSDI